MSDQYWVLPPDSADPPKEPKRLADLTAAWRAGTLDPRSTVCRVGDSTWLAIEAVLGPQRPPIPVVEAALAVPLPNRQEIAARYQNLTGVATGLGTYGDLLKLLGLMLGICAVAGGLFAMTFNSGFIAAAVLVLGLAFGIGFFTLGMAIAAVGEGLHAVRDTAVNTRMSADLALRPSP